MESAIAEFSQQFDRESLPWMQQAAYDRGTFASLLGVRRLLVVDAACEYEVLAIGDSIAALCDGDELVETWRYTSADEFDARPELLSTLPAENFDLLSPEALGERTRRWRLDGLKDPAILCMTDALGRWFIENHDNGGVRRLRSICLPLEFGNFVTDERAAGRLQLDDTTLLVWRFP
jgi:hypothetical protein